MGRVRSFADKQGRIFNEPTTYFNPKPQKNGYVWFYKEDYEKLKNQSQLNIETSRDYRKHNAREKLV